MNRESAEKTTIIFRGIDIYWGWVVVLGAFLMLSLNYGARYSFGIFVKPMFLEYQWPMSIISLGASINIVMYALSGIASGWLLDRMAPRWIMTCGAIVTALGFFLASFTKSPAGLYLSYGVLCGLGGAGIGLVVSSSSVGKWFVKKQGMAMGIATMGIGFGTMALTPLAGYITKHYDWRTGFLTLGAIILVAGISISQTLMRKSHPEDCGIIPDNESNGENGEQTENNSEKLSMKALLRNHRYWILALFFGIEAVVFMSAFVHQVAYAVNSGVEKVAAAASLGAIGIAGLCGRFFFGWFSDKIKSARIAAIVGIFIMAAGMFILSKMTTAKGLYLYALVFGFGYGSFAPLMPVLISEQFGRHILGSAYGSMNFFVMGIGGSAYGSMNFFVMGIGGGLGPLIGGFIFDAFGTYTYVWLFNMVALIIVSFFMMALRKSESMQK